MGYFTMTDLMVIAILIGMAILGSFTYFSLFQLPKLLQHMKENEYKPERSASPISTIPKKKTTGKGRVYNPSKDLDRTMSKGKPKIFD